MLIPSIDLMGGKIVQLVQGEKKALEFDDFEPWVERFSKYPLVQLIDLDAAIGSGKQSRPGAFPGATASLPGRWRHSNSSNGTRNSGKWGPAGHHRIVADKRRGHQHFVRGKPGERGWRREIGFCRGFKRRESRNSGMAADYRNFRRTNDPRRSSPGAARSSTPISTPRDFYWACPSTWFPN